MTDYTHTWIDAETWLLAELGRGALPGVYPRADGSILVAHDDRAFIVSLEWDDVTADLELEDG